MAGLAGAGLTANTVILNAGGNALIGGAASAAGGGSVLSGMAWGAASGAAGPLIGGGTRMTATLMGIGPSLGRLLATISEGLGAAVLGEGGAFTNGSEENDRGRMRGSQPQ